MRHPQLTCIECSSTFFYVARAEQFQAGGYNTVEFRSLSNAPKTVLVCVGCGIAVAPKPSYAAKGTVAAEAEGDFIKSFEGGQKYRKARSLDNIVKITASMTELQEVKDQLEMLKADMIAAPMLNKKVEPTKPRSKSAKASKGAVNAPSSV
jgi:hypothetical protein